MISFSATGLTIQNDWNANGAIDNTITVTDPVKGTPRGEQVIYALSGTNLTRRETGVDGTPQVLISGRTEPRLRVSGHHRHRHRDRGQYPHGGHDRDGAPVHWPHRRHQLRECRPHESNPPEEQVMNPGVGGTAMSSWRSLILNERGVALPLALICLVALTVMVLTFLTLSGVEPQISQNLTDTARARYLAESGVEWAFKQVAASPVGVSGNFAASLFAGPDNVQNTADDQQPTNVTGQNTAAMHDHAELAEPAAHQDHHGGHVLGHGPERQPRRRRQVHGRARWTAGNKFTDNNGIVIVTSTGTYRGATRTIQVALKRVGLPPFPGAVNIPGFQADTFLSDSVNAGNANRYDIDGRDYDRNGTANAANPNKLGIQVQPGIQADLGITYEARVEQPFDDANICTGGDCSNPAPRRQTGRPGSASSRARTRRPGAYTTGLNTIGPDGSLTPTVMNELPAADRLEPGDHRSSRAPRPARS